MECKYIYIYIYFWYPRVLMCKIYSSPKWLNSNWMWFMDNEWLMGSNNVHINLSVRSSLRHVRIRKTIIKHLERFHQDHKWLFEHVWTCLNIKICWLMLDPIWCLKKVKSRKLDRCAAAPAAMHIGQPPRACHEARLPDSSNGSSNGSSSVRKWQFPPWHPWPSKKPSENHQNTAQKNIKKSHPIVQRNPRNPRDMKRIQHWGLLHRAVCSITCSPLKWPVWWENMGKWSPKSIQIIPNLLFSV